MKIFLCTEEPNQILTDNLSLMKLSTYLEIYRNILCHKLHRDVEVRPAGFGIEQNLFWLVVVASGLINGKNIPEQFGIVLI